MSKGPQKMTQETVGGSTRSTATGLPIEVLAPLRGGPRIDSVLSQVAARAPEQAALHTELRTLSYAELDAEATSCAAALRAALGSAEAVVAVTAALDETFPIAFYGIARAGYTSALVSPLLREDGLIQVLGPSRARVAVVGPDSYRRLSAVRERLPDLELVVLSHRDADLAATAADVPTLAELMGRTVATEVPEAHQDPERVACLQFTNGTTGAPKAVQLTHRNLEVNAAQTAYAHQLERDSVLFDYLPTFHLMHLTASVAAGATLVLHTGADVVAAVATAASRRTTHFYSLPVRLILLAVNPGLPELEAPTLRAVLSGGSTMPPQATSALGQHFGVPVVQGYGLAESSPLATCDRLDRPKVGSSGPPVPGSETRIVDVETRAVTDAGMRGEIEIRGPQLMSGYLGRDRSLDLTPDGWFATGDIGQLDEDGCLFVVDRIKDVFKCDNWLVSPTEIERVLLRHPSVADCAVVDVPDPFSGAVAYGLVVPRDEHARPEDMAAFVSESLPYYAHLRRVEFVESIPRTVNGGKVLRRELRAQVRDRLAG